MATSIPKTMRAWRYSSVPSTLEQAIKLETTAPLPPNAQSKDIILVKVHAACLNPADYKIPELPGIIARRVIGVPAIPGMDFAGTVVATGSAVQGFSVGQRVFGRTEPGSWGSLCEYVAVKRASIATLPDNISFEDASGLGTAALTSYQLIQPNVVAGDKVFINGGSGGTGTYGIQIAKALGCHVTVSCSGKNAELCKGIGADEVIDYTQEDVSATLRAKGQVFKLVVDTVGHSPLDLYKSADVYLKPEGKYLQIGGEMSFGQMKTAMSRMALPSILGGGKRKFDMPMAKSDHDDFTALAGLLGNGKVRTVTDTVFGFEKAPDAIVKLKEGRTKGKIIIRII